ncbi:MAG TPA: hypothetical protein VFG69_06745 [Nannocystaceae bacterium]|nr:hypothetical protein [Nannocystaceae bacterium]
MRRRVFSEHVDAARLRRPDVLRALAERRVQLVTAVRPGGEDDIVALVADARVAGVSIALWPMIADDDGRWASTASAPRWCAYTDELFATLARADALPDELCIDLEPPIALVRAWSAVRPRRAAVAGDRTQAAVAFTATLERAHGLGVPTWGAAVPLVLADRPGFAMWQHMLGTPVDALPLTGVCVMLYSSLVGYTRGLLRRDHGEALVWLGAAAARRRWHERAMVGLGAIGKGALGDEPVYADVDELVADVALARAAGVDDLALFDLGGALDRPPFERWLDAFVATAPASGPPRLGKRVRALTSIARGLARLAAATFGTRR